MAKSMTLRLSDEQAAQLEAVARVKRTPVAAIIRDAIDNGIESLRDDEEFQAELRRHLEEHREVLEQLKRDGD